jgi:tetratricopeptide (TPR) repeat protein
MKATAVMSENSAPNGWSRLGTFLFSGLFLYILGRLLPALLLSDIDYGSRYQHAEPECLPSNYETVLNDPDFHINLGYALTKRGWYDYAETALYKAIELSPQAPLAYNNLGWLYLQQKKYWKAVENLQRALQLVPGSPISRNNLYDAYQRLMESAPNPAEKARLSQELQVLLAPAPAALTPPRSQPESPPSPRLPDGSAQPH